MSDLKNRCLLFYDYGLFAEVALRLARDFGRVLYYVPWKTSFCHSAPAHVGVGLAKNMERIDHFWDAVPEADIVVFGEIPDADAQKVVVEKFGKPVLGHRGAERLETDRWGTRRLQRDLGIAAPRTKRFSSVEDMVEYLKTHENKWVKLSTFRGDSETFHHENWHATEIYIDKFVNRVGALKNRYEFLVEDHIEGIEIGYDGWHVRGQFPSSAYWGFEVKDRGYIGRFSPYLEIPEPVRFINSKMAPILAREEAAGFCSFEFRLGRDGIPYLIDPCMRFASPPTEALMEGYSNFSQIVWDAANGRMAAPECLGTYLAIALIHCPEALTNWVPLDIPADIRRWVKVRNAAVIDGKLYHVPTDHEMPEVGAVVGIADTLEEAIEQVKDRAEQVKGYGLDIKVDALDSAQEEIAEAAEYGITF